MCEQQFDFALMLPGFIGFAPVRSLTPTGVCPPTTPPPHTHTHRLTRPRHPTHRPLFKHSGCSNHVTAKVHTFKHVYVFSIQHIHINMLRKFGHVQVGLPVGRWGGVIFLPLFRMSRSCDCKLYHILLFGKRNSILPAQCSHIMSFINLQ